MDKVCTSEGTLMHFRYNASNLWLLEKTEEGPPIIHFTCIKTKGDIFQNRKYLPNHIYLFNILFNESPV